MEPDPTDFGGVTALERQQLRVVGDGASTFWHRVRFSLVGRVVRRVGATSLLDVGAGSGQLGDWSRRHLPGVSYRFRETSAPLAQSLRERFGAEAEVPADQALADHCLVAMLDVLEHISDDAAALQGLHRQMPEGSSIVITVPALPSLFSQWDTDLGHHRRYTRSTLRKVVSGAGFEVQSVAYLFPELLPLAALRRLRRGTSSGADFPVLPRWVDRTGEVVSTGTTALRRLWPAGTSLLCIAQRKA